MGTEVYCIVVPIVILIAWFVISNQMQAEARRKIAAARLVYQGSLGKLKASPTDPNLKQQTLALGRAYANLTRNRKGVTIFDEMALMNDINAATAGANAPTAAISAPVQAVLAAATVAERLRKLDDLKAQGLLSETEYAAQRTKILGEL